MPHRATFLANDGVFDRKRAGTGQNRRHLQKQLPINRGQTQPQSRQPVGSVGLVSLVSLVRQIR